MRKILINVIDNSFIIFVLFLFNFLWCRYFFVLGVALLLSFLLTIALSLFFLFLRSNKSNKLLLTKHEQSKILDVKNYLLYNSMEDIKNLLKLKINAVFVNENICEINNVAYYVYPFELNKLDVIKIVKDCKMCAINIICADVSKEGAGTINEIEKPKINIVDSKQLVLKFGLDLIDLDSRIVLKKEKKFSFKDFLKLFVREENAKGYLIGAMILIISTLIIRQKFYYYVFISVLLILSLVCKLKPQILRLRKK